MVGKIILIFIGFSAGISVSAGIFAFIAAIGVVPRMAQRSQTEGFIRLYEDMIILGGVFGATAMYIDYRFPEIASLVALYALAIGVFVGVLSVALAEMLNVIPILLRRVRLVRGLPWLLLFFALGKAAGALLYFCIDGFYVL